MAAEKEKEKQRVRFKLDLEKTVLISNCEKRGWKRTSDDRDWNFFWYCPSLRFVSVQAAAAECRPGFVGHRSVPSTPYSIQTVGIGYWTIKF
jgi:hypothetical protein